MLSTLGIEGFYQPQTSWPEFSPLWLSLTKRGCILSPCLKEPVRWVLGWSWVPSSCLWSLYERIVFPQSSKMKHMVHVLSDFGII